MQVRTYVRATLLEDEELRALVPLPDDDIPRLLLHAAHGRAGRLQVRLRQRREEVVALLFLVVCLGIWCGFGFYV